MWRRRLARIAALRWAEDYMREMADSWLADWLDDIASDPTSEMDNREELLSFTVDELTKAWHEVAYGLRIRRERNENIGMADIGEGSLDGKHQPKLGAKQVGEFLNA